MNKNLALGMRAHKTRTHRHSKKMWMADASKTKKQAVLAQTARRIQAGR